MAAMAIAIVLVVLTALAQDTKMKDPGLERRHRGHRLRARLGCVPRSHPAAAGLGWGGVGLAGGGVFIAVAEWETRRPAASR